MVREWQATRDWLTRELTVDSINEAKMSNEKQVFHLMKNFLNFFYVIPLIYKVLVKQSKTLVVFREVLKGSL